MDDFSLTPEEYMELSIALDRCLWSGFQVEEVYVSRRFTPEEKQARIATLKSAIYKIHQCSENPHN